MLGGNFHAVLTQFLHDGGGDGSFDHGGRGFGSFFLGSSRFGGARLLLRLLTQRTGGDLLGDCRLRLVDGGDLLGVLEIHGDAEVAVLRLDLAVEGHVEALSQFGSERLQLLFDGGDGFLGDGQCGHGIAPCYGELSLVSGGRIATRLPPVYHSRFGLSTGFCKFPEIGPTSLLYSVLARPMYYMGLLVGSVAVSPHFPY